MDGMGLIGIFSGTLAKVQIIDIIDSNTKHLRYLKWRNPHQYKLYEGFVRENPPPQEIVWKKVQEALHF